MKSSVKLQNTNGASPAAFKCHSVQTIYLQVFIGKLSSWNKFIKLVFKKEYLDQPLIACSVSFLSSSINRAVARKKPPPSTHMKHGI